MLVAEELVLTNKTELAESVHRDLSPAETRAFFDKKALSLLGISGDEFRRRWQAGDYDEIADDPEHSDIMYLALLGDVR